MENEPAKRLVSTWEAITKDNEGEAHIHTLHKYDAVPEDIGEDLFLSQAAPTIVRPTKRTRPEGDFETYMFYGDTHHPFQNERAMALAGLAIREVMPDVVTFIGDDNDMALFSSFESRQDWLGSTQRGIDQVSQLFAQTRADIGPDGKIVAHKGNHEERLEREVRKYNGELIGLRQAGKALGVLTMAFLLRTEEFGVEYVGDRNGIYWHTDELKSYHGKVINSNGLAVTKELKEENVNFVHGHTHNAGIAYRTFRNGREEKTIFGMEVGTFADPNKIPSGQFSTDERGNVSRQLHNWQTGLGMVSVGNGVVIPQFIPINENGILIDRKWYKS